MDLQLLCKIKAVPMEVGSWAHPKRGIDTGQCSIWWDSIASVLPAFCATDQHTLQAWGVLLWHHKNRVAIPWQTTPASANRCPRRWYKDCFESFVESARCSENFRGDWNRYSLIGNLPASMASDDSIGRRNHFAQRDWYPRPLGHQMDPLPKWVIRHGYRKYTQMWLGGHRCEKQMCEKYIRNDTTERDS